MPAMMPAMTPAQSAWLRARIAEGVARHDELVANRQALADWPRSAWADPPALLVYATEALYAYYLGPDGTVYVHDMDRFAQELDEVTNPEAVREVYQQARTRFPELGL